MGSPAERGRDQLGVRSNRPLTLSDQLPQEMIAPIISGAYARGMADMFDLLDLPALMIGRDGRVLFANRPARTGLDDGLRLEAEHLVARSPSDNRLLSTFLAEVIDAPQSNEARSLEMGSLSLHAIPVAAQLAELGQLVRVVLVIDRGIDDSVAKLVLRMTALHQSKGTGSL